MNNDFLQRSWKVVIKETHKIPHWETLKKSPKKYRSVVLLRELLLFCQILLNKIESGEDIAFNSMIYKKTINFYCAQMKEHV